MIVWARVFITLLLLCTVFGMLPGHTHIPSHLPTAAPTKSPYTDFCIANNYDPLACWLSSVEFNLLKQPICMNTSIGKPISFPVELCIDHFECDGIFLKSLPSFYSYPTTFGLDVNGFGFYCEGNMTAHRTNKLLPGQFVAKATIFVNSTDFNIAVDVPTSPSETSPISSLSYELPASAEFSSCNVTNLDTQLEIIQESG